MIDPIQHPAFNPVVWLSLAAILTLLWQCIRFRKVADGCLRGREAVRRLLSKPVAICVCLAAAALAGFASYMSYAAPHDIVQDIVSARRILRGESAYPEQMSWLIKSELRSEPARWSLQRFSPELREKERHEGQPLLLYQAHPPLLVMLTVPLVLLAGIHETALMVDLFALVGLIITLVLIQQIFEFHFSPIASVVLLAAILCWSPVLSLLRQSQSGLFIAPLLALAWFFLRRNWVIAAGIPLGIATCLKLYPGLFLLYVCLRYRRALISAIPTMIVLVLLPVPWVGWHAYADYLHAAGGVVQTYGAQGHDISTLSTFRKNGMAMSTTSFTAICVVVIGIAAWLISRRKETPSVTLLDAEYSLITVLMLLLSPIVWDHYLVLLLLPLFVLGERSLRSEPNWLGMFCFFGVVLVLSVPMNSYVLSYPALRISRLTGFRMSSIPTISLVILAGWMTRLVLKTGPAVSRYINNGPVEKLAG